MDERVKVIEHFLAKAKTGSPSVKIVLQNEAGEKLYYDCWLLESCKESTFKVLRDVLRWQGNDLNELNNTDELCGRECVAVVEEEEYNGKVRQKVKFLNAIGYSGSEFGKEEIAELNKLFGGKSNEAGNEETPF